MRVENVQSFLFVNRSRYVSYYSRLYILYLVTNSRISKKEQTIIIQFNSFLFSISRFYL